jgi:hypothetical protein
MYTDRNKSSDKTLTILMIAIFIVIGLGAYIYLDRDRLATWLAKEVIEEEIRKEKEPFKEKIAALEKEVAVMKEDAEARAPSLPEKRMQEVFGGEIEAPSVEAQKEETEEERCKALQERVQNLFDYLDKQDYIAPYKLKEGTYTHLKDLVHRLLKAPPVVTRETDSLLRVLQNSAHIFRTLGKNNTYLLRDMLKKDGDIVEPSFDLLYQVVEVETRCRKHGLEMSLPLEDIYDYAVFFMNTLGGRSYLMRRDSSVRILTQYYSILILDQQNRKSLNKWGLDIRYPIDSLISDLKGSANLTYRSKYLRTLRGLKDKYGKLYGEKSP